MVRERLEGGRPFRTCRGVSIRERRCEVLSAVTVGGCMICVVILEISEISIASESEIKNQAEIFKLYPRPVNI